MMGRFQGVVAWDTETARFTPGRMAPPLACVTHQSWDCVVGTQGFGQDPQLVYHTEAAAKVREWLLDPNLGLVGHNVAYDIAVMCAHDPTLTPLFFAALAADRITDTLIREQLLDIAKGRFRGYLDEEGKWHALKYSLFDVTRKYTGRLLDKDEWRLKYGELREIPLADWPEGAKEYPKLDAAATLAVWQAQEREADLLGDQYRQVRAAVALHLASVWGIRTDPAAVAKLTLETEEARKEIFDRLVEAGLVRPNGTRDTKAAAAYMSETCTQLGLPLRRTATYDAARHGPGDCISLDEDACAATGDDLLADYAAYTTLGAVLSKDVPMLAAGARAPIHTRFGLVETGRTSSSGPNIQNIRRKVGIREAFVPRPGYVFADADYDQLELRTLAQACLDLLGASELAKALNTGLDPHTAFAAGLARTPYEEGLKRHKAKEPQFFELRQMAKVANFGFMGGLGPEKLVKFARASGVVMTKQAAIELKGEWLIRWPEMRDYFRLISKMTDNPSKTAVIKHLRSGRIRAGASYTVACNSFPQGLGADAAKNAMWQVSKACYTNITSPLYNSRPVNFIHDQIIIETPDTPNAHDAATELARIMIDAANEWLPDVPAKTDPCLFRYWSKDAFAVFDENNRLIPWDGHKK